MSQDIAESGNLFPVGIRVSLPEFSGKVLDRFTYNLKVTDNSIPSSPVLREIIEGDPTRVFFYIPNRFKDIIKELE